MRNQTRAGTICLSAFLLMVLLIAGCALFKKKQGQPTVEHRSISVPVVGYKTTIKIKASPEQVDQYLREAKSLEADAGTYKLKILSKKKIEKVGDSLEGKGVIGGLSIPGQFMLVYYQPKEEIWYAGKGELGRKGVMKFGLTEVEGGTKVTIKFEVEENKAVLTKSGGQLINFSKAMSKILEKAIARGQVHFDPSLKVEELLEKGERGEFYHTFYQEHQLSIGINAPLKTVSKFLTDPKNWKAYQEKYNLEFSSCLVTGKESPCPVKVKFWGISYEFNSFPLDYKYGENLSAYWVHKLIIARIQIGLKSELNGTRSSVSYTTELPGAFSPESAALLMNLMQLPNYLEKILLNLKNDLEGINLKAS